MGIKFSIRDDDKGLKSIVRELSKATEPHVKVGVLSDSGQYADGNGVGGKTANLADVATWMEFGTHTIPARPFLSQAFDSNQERVVAFIKAQHALVVTGKKSVDDALKAIGLYFEGVVKKTMASGKFAPIKKETIRRKKSSKPLIDTGRLRQSITSKVVLNPGGGSE